MPAKDGQQEQISVRELRNEAMASLEAAGRRLTLGKPPALQIADRGAGQLLAHLEAGGTCLLNPLSEPNLRELIDYYAATKNVSPDDVPLGELAAPPAEDWCRFVAARSKQDAGEESSIAFSKSGDAMLQLMAFEPDVAERLLSLAHPGQGGDLMLSLAVIENGEGEQQPARWGRPRRR